ncbi:MAG: hypothetical protein EOM17_11515, partial [Synergistales bacterium]|nr:hypothetical protein [Synergistales bacterium]
MDRHFLNLHVLISHSSSCLNRDDMNMQKSAYFGGVRRIRVSSQCQKRAIRMSERYKELFGAPSTRTRQDADLFDHFRNQERFKTYSDALLEYIIRESKMDNKVVTPWIDDEMEKLAKMSTEYLREEAISHDDFMALIEKAEKEAIDATEASDKKKKSKNKKEPKNNSLEGLTKALEKGSKEYLAAGISCIDIALSGRMCASGVLQNVEGALSMAHSITTHAMEAEIDWFTAMDDLKEEAAEEAGAGHLEAEHLEDRRAGNPFQFGGASAGVVRRGPAGPVGPQGQGNVDPLARDHVKGIGAVSGGVDPRHGTLHAPVHRDGPAGSQVQTRRGGHFAVGRHADGRQHHIGAEVEPVTDHAQT